MHLCQNLVKLKKNLVISQSIDLQSLSIETNQEASQTSLQSVSKLRDRCDC